MSLRESYCVGFQGFQLPQMFLNYLPEKRETVWDIKLAQRGVKDLLQILPGTIKLRLEIFLKVK